MSESTPQDLPEHALLENAAFLRRLAQGLLGEVHAAEDVAQDAMALALSRPREFLLNRSWLAGVVRRLALGRRRSLGVQRRCEQAAAEERSELADTTERVRIQQRVTAAVLTLDEPYRSAILQRYFHGRRPESIARELGATPAAVRQRLARARRMLRARLEPEFQDESGGYTQALVLLGGRALPTGSGLVLSAGTLAVAWGWVGIALVILSALAWQGWRARSASSGGEVELAQFSEGTAVQDRRPTPSLLDVGARARRAAARRQHLPAPAEVRSKVDLPESVGAVLSGQILLEGLPYSGPSPLWIVSSTPPPNTTRGEALIVDGTGHFRIEGMAPNWSGQLRAANGFQLLNSRPALNLRPQELQIREPLEGLKIDLVRTPVLRGRVRWSHDGEPVEQGLVELAVLFKDGSKSYRSRFDLNEGGIYTAGIFPYADPYARPEIESVLIEVFPEGGETREALFAHHTLSGFDLPTIDVHPTPGLHLLVQDPTGRPIPNALVAGHLRRDYGTVPLHTWTDRSGRGRLPYLPRAAQHVTAGAEGFGVRRIPLGPERGDSERPLVIELRPANRLEISLEGEARLIPMLRVALHSEGPLLESERGEVDAVRMRFLQLLGTGIHPGPRDHRRSYSDPDEIWVLSDLVPFQQVMAEVSGPHGAVLKRVSLRSPGDLELKRVSIPVDADLRILSGRITDSEGRGLAGARVAIEWEQLGWQWLAATREDGRFEAEQLELPQRALFLWIDARGFATRRLPFTHGLSDDDLGTVQLEPERVVEVRLIEAEGCEHSPERLWAKVAQGFEIDGQAIDGRHRLSGLPDGPLTVSVSLGGRAYSQECVSPPEQLVFEVPRHGFLAPEVEGARLKYVATDEDMWTVQAEDGSGVEWRIRGDQPGRHALLPGSYRLERGGETRSIVVRAGETVTLK